VGDPSGRMSLDHPDRVSRRAWALAAVVLCLMTLGEIRLFDRLLFGNAADCEFVLRNIRGILARTPVWKAWQNRLLGPAAVRALSWVTRDPVASLKVFCDLMILAANALLFALVRRKGATLTAGLLAVVAFGFARIFLFYKLEYPWDGVDVLLFLAFGAWAARERTIVGFFPLLLIGVLNHETVLYIPLWYLLAPLDRTATSRRQGSSLVVAGLLLAFLGGGILALRSLLYLGRPALSGHVFEAATPLIANPIHLIHNLGQFLFGNWKSSLAFISGTLICALALLTRLISSSAKYRRAAVWTFAVLASIFCFGYVNETRLYLPVVAFWFTYAWPPSRPLTRT
jgi:hypothetical protein